MKRVLQKMKKNNHICIGSVGRSKGLNGEFYLNSFCNPKENIIDYIKDIVFLSDSKLEIEYIKKCANKLFSKIKNINDVDSVKEYTNQKLYLNMSSLPKLPMNEFYWNELIGMKVEDENEKKILGIVKALENYGANDCLVVKPFNDSIDNKTRLIPYINEIFIKSVDIKQNIIKVDWRSDY